MVGGSSIMIHYPIDNYRFSTKEEVATFTQWVDLDPKIFIKVFGNLLELTEKCHEENSAQPLHLTVDLVMRCYADMIIESHIM